MSEPASLAIIGISCMFPKADNVRIFWRNIKNGVDAITPIPEESHWKTEDYFNPDPKAADRTYARRGGFLSPIAFNPMEYGISPKDVEATDTTQLLGMVAAKQALADAGYEQKPFNHSRTSVILGVTGALELVIPLGARLGHPIWRRALKAAGVPDTVAEDVVQRIADSYVSWQENSFPGLLGNVTAGRIANRLDLGGTNCVVDAACASSMGALHLACLELATGKADMVITGGVDTFNDIFMYMCFSKTPALSPTGDAKPFDRHCDGTILGEGLGMLVLKRLADAERAGDRIYAVVKGIGTSSDGHGNAIYAPRIDGQKEALERAYAAAQITPDTLELIEAHGTGTKVGDATELQALTDVFRAVHGDGTWSALGSVKSQIGHTKAAAGVAGLIKAALALHHKVLPPTIKVSQPIDEAAPGCSPFYINTQKRPWLPRETHPRRAGVSAFGFGGTNFHCVLEEHGAQAKEVAWDGEVEILAFSSDQLEELHGSISRLPDDPAWRDLRQEAYQSRVSFQREGRYRLLWPITQGTTLKILRDAALSMLEKHPEKLSWTLPNGIVFGTGERQGKLGALFPGQGSQYVGMFRDLACQFPVMLEVLAMADRIFTREHPEQAQSRLSDFIYPHPAFSDEARHEQEEDLKSTDIAQPALGAVSLGALEVLTDFGVTLEAAGGHSYGELLALCGAGRLQPESLHLLSNVRGRLMANRNGNGDRGAMLAVQATEETVIQFVRDEHSQLVIANRNSPGQFVLAGPKDHIEQAAHKLTERSIRTRLLPVSAAFHSALVADARAPFASALEHVPFSHGQIPVYANSTARPYPSEAAQARDLLASQMVNPVDFMAQIETMFQEGVTAFLEVGPGHVLSDLVQSILPGREIETIALDASRGTRSGIFDLAVTLCRLAALGHPIKLERWEADLEPVQDDAGHKMLLLPISGANYRHPHTPRPPANPACMSELTGKAARPTASVPPPVKPAAKMPPTLGTPLAPIRPAASQPSEPSDALAVAQQGMLYLQKLQEQTAQLHKQFLENQESARRTLESLLGERRELLHPCGPGQLHIPTLSGPAAAPIEPPAPATSPAMPIVPLPVTPVPFITSEESPPELSRIDSTMVGRTVLEVVAEKTGYPVDMLELRMGLDSDLGVDSIKRVEIMAALRGRLPAAPEIKPEQLGTLQTLQDVVDFLSNGTDANTPNNSNQKPALGYEQTQQVLLTVVAEKTGYPVEMLNLEMGLDSDLGIDSIKRVEIMAAVRLALPLAPEIKPEHLGRLQTLQQVVEFLTGKPESQNQGKGEAAVQSVAARLETSIRTVAEPLLRQIVRPVELLNADERPVFALPQKALIWVTEDDVSLAAAIEVRLQKRGYLVRRGTLNELAAGHAVEEPAGLVIVWPPARGSDRFLKEAFRLMQKAGSSLRKAGRNAAGIFLTVSRLDGEFGFSALNGKCDPVSGGLAGLVKTARHEWPEVNCKALDLDPELNAGPEIADRIVEEMFRLGPVEVGLTGTKSVGLNLEAVPLVKADNLMVLEAGDLVVASGGARGITAIVALHLALRYQPKLVLLGRSQLIENEPDWLAGMEQETDLKKELLARSKGDRSPKVIEAKYQEIQAQREIREHLHRIRAGGSTVLYRTVNVRDASAVEKILVEIRRELGPIRGLIHGAGVLADKRIEDKTEEQFELVYSTKALGLKHLLAATAQDDLKLLALFSSYSGRFGRLGQVDYAVANEVLNKIAQVEARKRPTCRVVSFNWGPWQGGMVSESLRKVFDREGVGLIDPQAGAQFFIQEISTRADHAVEVLVSASSPGRIASHTTSGTEREVSPMSPAFESEVSVQTMPCLESHVLNGRAVLPAALMIEWLAHGALHGNPGFSFHGFDHFKILKGMVLGPGGTIKASVLAGTVQMREGKLCVPVQLVSQAEAQPILHARAEIVLTETLPAPPATEAAPAPHRQGSNGNALYGNGRLFHGPHFQSIEQMETCTEHEAAAWVKSAPSPKNWIHHPLRINWISDPMILDAGFQMMILWSWTHRAAASLPCALRSFRQFVPAFPKSGCRVIIQITSAAAPVVTADLRFQDQHGNLLALAEGYECVVDAALADAFRRNRLMLEE